MCVCMYNVWVYLSMHVCLTMITKYEMYANLHLGFLDPEMTLHFFSHLF